MNHFNNIGEELGVAGPTSTPDDAPFGLTWYGAVLSFQDFVKNVARSQYEVRLQTVRLMCAGTTLSQLLISNDLAAALRDALVYAVAAVEDDAECSRRAQLKYAR